METFHYNYAQKGTSMSVKIFHQTLPYPEGKVPELTVLLKRLRSVTLMQPGYISGQTHQTAG
jgi:hypothetical protein